MSDTFLHASPDERIALIEARLNASLAPLSLAVRDDSAQHAGHAGAGEPDANLGRRGLEIASGG